MIEFSGGGGKLPRLWIRCLLWKSTLTIICRTERHWFWDASKDGLWSLL